MTVRHLITAALLCTSMLALAQYPPGGRERAEKFFAALTKDDRDLMIKAQEATTAALTEYFHGTMERAIPLLQRSIELDRQQIRAFATASERAGLPDWNESEPTIFHLLALSHGRLARAYFLTNRREECLNQLALAVDLGAGFVAKAKREAMLQEVAGKYGMDSPEKVFTVVQRYDEADRQRIRPARPEDPARSASGNQYTPGKADCLLEGHARQP